MPPGIRFHQFNIGYHNARVEAFHEALCHIRAALANGKSVIVHCEAGVHRAATMAALCLMFEVLTQNIILRVLLLHREVPLRRD